MTPWLAAPALACLFLTVFGKVPAPRNVRLNSVNFRHVLQWDSPVYHGGNLTYTAKYMRSSCIDRSADDSSLELRCRLPQGSTADSENRSNVHCIDGFEDTCQKTFLTKCMFSGLHYGLFCLSVKSNFNNNTSDWESIHFNPLTDTIIGPPSDLVVKSRTGFLDLSFECPVYEPEQRCLSQIYGSWMYIVRYWKKDTSSQVNNVTTEQSFVTLSNLEPWTIYCLQVQASAPEFEKTGELTRVVCEKTSDDGKLPLWILILAFLVAAVVVLSLAICGFFLYLYSQRITKYIFFPTCSFPQHLKEFLSQPVYDIPFPPVNSNKEADELCIAVTVLSEECESKRLNEGSADTGARTAERDQAAHEPFLS
ncbi:interleukin-10 receptor subunit beta [Lissotriton helveticus]